MPSWGVWWRREWSSLFIGPSYGLFAKSGTNIGGGHALLNELCECSFDGEGEALGSTLLHATAMHTMDMLSDVRQVHHVRKERCHL